MQDGERLVALARATPWFMQALAQARALRLQTWCVGAGAVRNLVWDALHGHATPSALADVDVAWFDAGDLAPDGRGALFAMVVRRNPMRVSVETYRQRVASKRYVQRWPRVTVIDALD